MIDLRLHSDLFFMYLSHSMIKKVQLPSFFVMSIDIWNVTCRNQDETLDLGQGLYYSNNNGL